jgi:hypothetical protein
MGNGENWWFICARCNERQRTSLQKVDWDKSPFEDDDAADENRRIEKNWRCNKCGSHKFQKDGRAFPAGWDGVERRMSSE